MQTEPGRWLSYHHLTQRETSRNVNGGDLWRKATSKKHSKNKVFVLLLYKASLQLTRRLWWFNQKFLFILLTLIWHLQCGESVSCLSNDRMTSKNESQISFGNFKNVFSLFPSAPWASLWGKNLGFRCSRPWAATHYKVTHGWITQSLWTSVS